MFAFKNEILGLIAKDPTATAEEKSAASDAVECKTDRNIKFREAAERLGVCRATVYALVKDGELVGVKARGKRPYAVSEQSLLDYMKRRRTS